MYVCDDGGWYQWYGNDNLYRPGEAAEACELVFRVPIAAYLAPEGVPPVRAPFSKTMHGIDLRDVPTIETQK